MISLSELAGPGYGDRHTARRWEDSPIRGGVAARGRCPGFAPAPTGQYDAAHVSPADTHLTTLITVLALQPASAPVIVST